MKVLVQRVLSASVAVSGETIDQIENGLLLFVGFTRGDNTSIAQDLANKAVNLRIFEDDNHRLQNSVLDSGGSILAVPQFTLYASTSRGRRPDFIQALEPDLASDLFDQFVQILDELMGKRVGRGVFGAYMKVSILNDGPFTVMLERKPD